MATFAQGARAERRRVSTVASGRDVLYCSSDRRCLELLSSPMLDGVRINDMVRIDAGGRRWEPDRQGIQINKGRATKPDCGKKVRQSS